jgi:hypothetical protein
MGLELAGQGERSSLLPVTFAVLPRCDPSGPVQRRGFVVTPAARATGQAGRPLSASQLTLITWSGSNASVPGARRYLPITCVALWVC